MDLRKQKPMKPAQWYSLLTRSMLSLTALGPDIDQRQRVTGLGKAAISPNKCILVGTCPPETRF